MSDQLPDELPPGWKGTAKSNYKIYAPTKTKPPVMAILIFLFILGIVAAAFFSFIFALLATIAGLLGWILYYLVQLARK